MARQGKGKSSSKEQEATLVLIEYEQQRLECIEGNTKNAENNFVHRFLIRLSSHEEPAVLGRKTLQMRCAYLAN
jgi:hypothetical protein